MSLTQHLTRGSLAAWFADREQGLRSLAEQVAAQVAECDPMLPREAAGRSHYAQVGGLVGHRLADLVEFAPPYASLLGAIRCGAISRSEAAAVAVTYPTHLHLPESDRPVAHHVRTVPGGGFWRTVPDGIPPDQDGGHSPAVHALLRMATRHTAAAPTSVPHLYLRDCLETVHRAGFIPPDLKMLDGGGEFAPPESVTADVVAVLRHQRRAYEQALALAGGVTGGRLGHAAPLLVPGWAEGDLLVGPHSADGGYTLLDVKTVKRADQTGRVLEWLRQIVAYACLDPRDRWRIRRVGLWLPRQDLVVVWSIEQVFDALGGNTSELLASIRTVCWEAVRADGGDPRILLGLSG